MPAGQYPYTGEPKVFLAAITEMNLMPKKFLKRQQLAQKQPYFMATVFSLVLVVLAIGGYYSKLASLKSGTLALVNQRAQPLLDTNRRLQSELRKLDQLKQEKDQLHEWSSQRFFWSDLLKELRQVLANNFWVSRGNLNSSDADSDIPHSAMHRFLSINALPLSVKMNWRCGQQQSYPPLQSTYT